MNTTKTLLEGSSEMEKGAYIGAIASLATADREATPEEVEHLTALCEAAQLSTAQTNAIIKAASNISSEDISNCLDILKTSDLKYSLITDLIAFAKSDQDYSEEEQQTVQKMAAYLGVNEKQYSLLDHFATKATNGESTPEEVANPKFLSSTGLKEKMENAGINGSTLLTGLIGIAAPLILGKLMGRNRRSGFGGGGLGGLGFGRGGSMMGGGLGSIIGMLSGGRGLGGLGGILGGIFGRRNSW